MTTDAPTRRRTVAGGVAALASVALVQVAGPEAARAATTYRPNPYRRTSVPSWRQRHYLNRLGCGFSRGTFAQLLRDGDAAHWLDHQLRPTTVRESATAQQLPSWFPDMDESPAAKWASQSAGTKGGWEYAADFAGYSMLRQVYSSRQVFENLVGFWSNHLHVNADHDTAWVWRKDYDDLIRRHALGRFEDMLVACSLHPAMLLYLDNWTSVRNAPNENQGRELLELHTVGRTAGYTEQMVKDSAKILSGYTVDAYKTWNGYYNANRHTTGPVQVLAFSSANASADGSQLTVDYLKYLANHPATAARIATKLARHFVADSPSADLVDTVAKVFLDSGTDIVATLRALVSHRDFDASHGTLVRNPVEDFVATCRTLGVRVHQPTNDQSFARSCIWVPQTTLLYQWPRPDGLPLGDAAWSSATRMLNSFRMHWDLAAGWWPTKDVSYSKSGGTWLPQPRIRLDQYVDHLCRSALGRGSDSRILGSVVAATGYSPSTPVTKDHPVCTWLFVRVLGVLLDSPEHMRR